MELRSVPPAPSSISEVGGVNEASWFLVDDKKGDGGRDTGPGRGTSCSCVPASLTTSEKDVTAGAGFISFEGVGSDSTDNCWTSSGTVLSSSAPSSSSSASLEESELSDSSLMASLTLSKTSTLARADATGRARLPRITEYRLFARSASRPRRSKCLAMFDTFPGPVEGLRNVDLLPGFGEGRTGVLSFERVDILCLLGFPLVDVDLTLEGDEGRLNLTSLPRPLNERFSGEGRREDSCDWKAEPIGPGIRLPLGAASVLLECVRYLGAMLAA